MHKKSIVLDEIFLKERHDAISAAIDSGIRKILDIQGEEDPDKLSLILKTVPVSAIKEKVWDRIRQKVKDCSPLEVPNNWFLAQAETVTICVIANGSGEHGLAAVPKAEVLGSSAVTGGTL